MANLAALRQSRRDYRKTTGKAVIAAGRGGRRLAR
jgi:hypothetical protein